ncbi:hypothetical protein BN2497_10421 [Janthinobacterium sp. CG23_2]|nr:hypothetical protein BN2497_10421 [Janthinobacterium sp. CG23_2]CUU31608.1 hypothetical protein BN3177_10421 [Janthinobacterium sp. CG23_2]
MLMKKGDPLLERSPSVLSSGAVLPVRAAAGALYARRWLDGLSGTRCPVRAQTRAH